MSSEFRNNMSSKDCYGSTKSHNSRNMVESPWKFSNDSRFNTIYLAISHAFSYANLDEGEETIELDKDLTEADLNPGVMEVDGTELKELLGQILETSDLSPFDHNILFRVTSSSDPNAALIQIFTENNDFVTLSDLESYFCSLLVQLQEHIASTGMEQTLKKLIGISLQDDDDNASEI